MLILLFGGLAVLAVAAILYYTVILPVVDYINNHF